MLISVGTRSAKVVALGADIETLTVAMKNLEDHYSNKEMTVFRLSLFVFRSILRNLSTSGDPF